MSIIQAVLGSGGQGPIEYIGGSIGSINATGTLSISVPAGAANGDLLVLVGFNLNNSISTVTRQPSGTNITVHGSDNASGLLASGDTSVLITFTGASTNPARYLLAALRRASRLSSGQNSGTLTGGTFPTGGGIQVACLRGSDTSAIDAPSGWTTIDNGTHVSNRFHFVRRTVAAGVISDVTPDADTDDVVWHNAQFT